MASLKSLDKLTLKYMLLNFQDYAGLVDGLIQLPVPVYLKIKRKYHPVPDNMEEFTKNICYGQRLFLTRKEDNDFGMIIRTLEGYYYPVVTRKKWDEDKALIFGKYIIELNVQDVYPAAMHLINLISEMIEQEKKLLYREPSKVELAAGIEKLNIFSDLTSLDFLRDVMKITIEEVLLTPYKECLVRFMIAKETAEYQDRYIKLMQELNKPKSKYVK